MYLLASLAACVNISVDGMTAFFGKKKLGHMADRPNVPKLVGVPQYHAVRNGNWVQKGKWPSIIALLKPWSSRYFGMRSGSLGKQRDYDLKSKLMEEPVRSAKTASHVETIEALKALAINRDFPTDMRSLSHRLLDTPVYAVSYSRAGLGLTM
eukprot:jgi/Tetstr1/466043/TSEL_010630.t1